MMKGLLVFFFSILIFNSVFAQRIIVDSTKVDSNIRIIHPGKHTPSPKKALLLSLVLPGAGQIYNKDWWKLPIVYGAIGGMAYAVNFNYKEYKRYKIAREQILEGKPNEFPGASEESIKAVRDYYRKGFELSCVGLGFVYLMQAIEAFVDAHLSTFDVDDDLGFKSYIDQTRIGPVYGLGFTYQLSK